MSVIDYTKEDINAIDYYLQVEHINKTTPYTAQTVCIKYNGIREADKKVKKEYSYGKKHLDLSKSDVRHNKLDNGISLRASPATNMFFIDLDDYEQDKVDKFVNMYSNDITKFWLQSSSSGGIHMLFAFDNDIYEALDKKADINGLNVNGFKIDIGCKKQCVIGAIEDGKNSYIGKWDKQYNPFKINKLGNIQANLKSDILNALEKSKTKKKEKKEPVATKTKSKQKQTDEKLIALSDLKIILEHIDADKRRHNDDKHKIVSAVVYETDKNNDAYELIKELFKFDDNELLTQWNSTNITKLNNPDNINTYTAGTLHMMAQEDTNFDLLLYKCKQARKIRVPFRVMADKWTHKLIESREQWQELLIDINKTWVINQEYGMEIYRYHNQSWKTTKHDDIKKMFYVREKQGGKIKYVSIIELAGRCREYMPVFDAEEFAPTQDVDEFIFNPWTGYKAYDPEIKCMADVDMKVVQPWIDLIKNGYAYYETDYNKEWLLQRFLAILQNPNIKLPTKIILYNPNQQKAMKGRLQDFFTQHVIGKTHCSIESGLKSLTARFNHDHAYLICMFIDEATTEGNLYHSLYSELKALDGDMFKTEEKFGNRKARKNKIAYIICTNFKDAVKHELGCERNAMYECREDHTEEFRNLIIKLHTDPYSAKHFLAFARFYTIDYKMLRNAPLTKVKRDVLNTCLPSPQRFLIELKGNRQQFFEDDEQKSVQASILYEKYVKWMGENDIPETQTGFGRQCKAYFQKVTRMKSGMYYEIDTLNIKEDICIRAKDDPKPKPKPKEKQKKIIVLDSDEEPSERSKKQIDVRNDHNNFEDNIEAPKPPLTEYGKCEMDKFDKANEPAEVKPKPKVKTTRKRKTDAEKLHEKKLLQTARDEAQAFKKQDQSKTLLDSDPEDN